MMEKLILARCPSCGASLNDSYDAEIAFCGQCGSRIKVGVEPDLEEPKPAPNQLIPIGTMIFIAIVIVILLLISASILPGMLNPDTDGDGFPDTVDKFPNDASEWLDTDSDGVGDNRDAFSTNSNEQVDSDRDGYGDRSDIFPLDPAEYLDTDLDGIGNNADLDDDNDNVTDENDLFPTDPDEWEDWDHDGKGDNGDYVYIQLSHETTTSPFSYGYLSMDGDTMYYVKSWWGSHTSSSFSGELSIDTQYLKSTTLPGLVNNTYYTFEYEYQNPWGAYLDEVFDVSVYQKTIYVARLNTFFENNTKYDGYGSSIETLSLTGTLMPFKTASKGDYYMGLTTDGEMFLYTANIDLADTQIYYWGRGNGVINDGDIGYVNVYDGIIAYDAENDNETQIKMFNVDTHITTIIASDNSSAGIENFYPFINETCIIWTQKTENENGTRYSIQSYDIRTSLVTTLIPYKEFIKIQDFKGSMLAYNERVNDTTYFSVMDLSTMESRHVRDMTCYASIGVNYIGFTDSLLGNIYYTKNGM